MPRYLTSQNSFTAGELSPKVFGRTDLAQYRQGLKILENMISREQGGASRRTGTAFISDLTSTFSSNLLTDSKLIPFISSDERTGVFLITRQVIWFFQNDDDITSITQFGGPDSTFDEGSGPKDIHYTQSGDLLILTHPDIEPVILTTDFSTVYVADFINYDEFGPAQEPPLLGSSISNGKRIVSKYPFRVNTDVDHTLNITTGGPPWTAGTSISVTSNKNLFKSSHESSTAGQAAIFKMTVGSVTGAFIIDSVTDANNATGTVLVDIPDDSGGVNTWSESAWSNARGWPRTATFYDSRLFFGGNKFEPDKIWGSHLNEFFRMSEKANAGGTDFVSDTTAERGFQFNLNAQTVSTIQWLTAHKTINTGTQQAEFIASASSQSAAINDADVASQAETFHGGKRVQPQTIGNAPVFCSRSGKSLRQFRFNFDQDRFASTDLNLLADHIVERGTDDFEKPTSQIAEIAVQNEEESILWARTTGNELVAATFNDSFNVLGWHRHRIGGNTVTPLNFTASGSTVDIVNNKLVITGGIYEFNRKVKYEVITGTPIGGLEDGKTYFARNIAIGEFVLAETETGNPVDLTSTGSGSHRFTTFLPPRVGALASVKSETFDVDEIFVLVERWIDGASKVFLEKMFRPVQQDTLGNFVPALNGKATPGTTPIYIDSAVFKSSVSPTNVFTVGTHLKGETLCVLADGLHIGDFVVDSLGQITLDENYSWIVAGYCFKAILETMPIASGSSIGSSQGSIQRIDEARARIVNSLGGKIGPDEDNMSPIIYRTSVVPMNAPIPLKTDDIIMKFDAGQQRRATVRVEHELPFPFNIDSLTFKGVTYD